MKLSSKDLLLALVVPLLWGMGFVVAKAGLDEFPPLEYQTEGYEDAKKDVQALQHKEGE